MAVILLFTLGVFLYILAALSTFTPTEFEQAGIDPFTIVALTSAVGLGVLALGYGSVIVLGGMLSLKLAEFISRLTRSRHVVEVMDEEPQTIRDRVNREAFLFYLPALIFILSVTLAWNIHNLHDPRTSIFHPLLHALDIFAKAVSLDPILHSLDLVPTMVVLVAIAGVAPSMVLPYFRRFKVTGVNSGPFHTDFLFTVVGLIVGLSALLTLVGFIYQVLWVGNGPIYSHYALLAMLGFSLHYALGASLGRDKSEDMVRAKLRAHSGERIIVGTVTIRPRASD